MSLPRWGVYRHEIRNSLSIAVSDVGKLMKLAGSKVNFGAKIIKFPRFSSQCRYDSQY